jgi:GT2 family glycosyltransferase
MRYGWEKHVKKCAFDYLLVFNDDIQLYPDALANLLRAAEEVARTGRKEYAVVGSFRDPATKATTYGGVVRVHPWRSFRFQRVDPLDKVQECDTLNMNFALISRSALDRVGFLSPCFTHAKADYDFGLRLRNRGGLILVAPGYMGLCARNQKSGTSAQPGIPLQEKWKRLTGVKEHAFRETLHFYRQHAGPLWPLLMASKYVRKLSVGARSGDAAASGGLG